MNVKYRLVRMMTVGCAFWLLGACGGDDSKDDSSANGPGGGAEGDDSSDDGDGSDGSESDATAESECSSSTECDMVVCDCPDGPVNYQGCSVFNGVGVCATASTCGSDFGACD